MGRDPDDQPDAPMTEPGPAARTDPREFKWIPIAGVVLFGIGGVWGLVGPPKYATAAIAAVFPIWEIVVWRVDGYRPRAILTWFVPLFAMAIVSSILPAGVGVALGLAVAAAVIVLTFSGGARRAWLSFVSRQRLI